MTPEWLPGVDVRQVHFDIRNAHCGKSVTECHTGMGEPRRVDDDPGDVLFFRLMYALDQSSFMVALKDLQYHSPAPSREAHPLVDTGNAFGPIDLRLAASKQIEVGAVKEQNFGPSSEGRTTFRFGHDRKFAADGTKLYSICRISSQEGRAIAKDFDRLETPQAQGLCKSCFSAGW